MSKQETSHSKTLAVKIISGSVGSTLTALVVTPLEVIKVRQQFHSPSSSSSSSAAAVAPSPGAPQLPPGVTQRSCCGTFVLNNGLKECVLPRSAVPFFCPTTGKFKEDIRVTRSRGTLGMLRNIWATEGVSGIYAGLRPTLIMGIPNTVLYFTTYEELKERLDTVASSSTLFSPSTMPAVAGAAARVVASVATAPLELIRTRQAAQIGGGQTADSLTTQFRKLIQSEGFSSLYKGLSPTLMRDVPFSALYWYSIETLRHMWGDSSNVSAVEQAAQAVFNGSVAGMISALCTTPLDVVKTRQQVAKEPPAFEPVVCCERGALAYAESNAPKAQASSNGTLAIVNQIIREEGVSGLWRGNQARMLKVAPACAIMLSSYEIGKRLLSEI